MTTLVPQEPLISALEAQWQAIADLASTLTDEQWEAPSGLPGWQIRDIVAHVLGTESMLAGRQPDATADAGAPEHVKNPIGELNERWVEHYRSRSRDELMSDYATVMAERSKALYGMTEGQWDAETATPVGPESYGRFMRIRVFDCWIHEIDIRDALGLGTPQNADCAHWAVREIETTLPYIVGKKARAEVGSTVRFDITGVYPCTIFIATEDRAAVMPAIDGKPDTTLTVDGVDLARLAGGRPRADESSVRVEGDTALGVAIVRQLHYTI
ncbi:maleylpyruvate isomerase family mycothiol-dependent enzyme [Gordonia sp. (in: high G+C Gram-positive bacteria)]|uniref:maleylpyruvate isomerase family mycothiol-dependent enzyme n=1 Tax=Gordonia sp. (in: high G+C Gram-positive bacteria) TaxID=84139 RepID=UPI0016B28471|nr:maleylpyruvate isomerase family mycothiol-dependent enzyme [Gordonia sp. (in: high G+C Gram-positive bacteria)]NLG48455.1 maleylpyruvate isomerase family mycothiol-dependent enzyme [Gordonia sp. (in: high G+C Gram-positive bacteria)]